MHLKRPAFLFLLMVLFAIPASALTIQGGLAPHQVFQCDKDGVASIAVSGTSAAAGLLQARVVGVQKEVTPWTDLGRHETGAWQVTLASVPAGGPYRIDLRICDDSGKALEEASVCDVLVGDVWVLAGQSNMQGVGNRVNVEAPHPLVHTFAMSYEWRLAQEPLHTLGESPDAVHASFPNAEERENAIAGWRDGPKGAGLGLAFAKEMVARTRRPLGLIASAHGGTSMAQWDPALKNQGGGSLYGSMCKQVQAAGGKVRGVLWYQGESDATSLDTQRVYRDKMKALVGAMRADFGGDIPFYYVQLSRFTPKPDPFPAWNMIQEDERLLEAELAPCGMVAAIDLSLDDGIHIGTQGLKTLGYRMACLAERDLYDGKVARGPRFAQIDVAPTPYGTQVRVKFGSVNGKLVSAGRVSGFTIASGPDGADAPCVFNQELAADDPNTVIVWVDSMPDNPHLWYGRGLNPYCSVVDEANMAVPVMGPIAIKK